MPWLARFLFVVTATINAAVAAQRPVGWRHVALDNPTGSGSARLEALVYYPAASDQRGERNVAIDTARRPFPVIVFLHGFGGRAGQMGATGHFFAARGYVVVLTDTTVFDRNLQAANGRAMYPALVAENAAAGSFFRGHLDMARAGLAGHSMGGGNTVRVLADNPGYRAGFCFAPWTTPSTGGKAPDYVTSFAKSIDVPLGIVHGVDDRVLPWQRNALRLYDALPATLGFKCMWLLDKSASHVNVAVPLPIPWRGHGGADNKTVFARCARLAGEFFDRFLKGRDAALADDTRVGATPTGIIEVRCVEAR